MEDFLKNRIYREDMENIYVRKENWKEFENSSVFISGAAGMIASYVCMFFIFLNETQRANIEIYAGIRNEAKARKRFGKYVERNYFHTISQDVSSPAKFTFDVDYIIHAASLASPQYYGNMPVETIVPNVIGTYELLKYAKSHHIKGFLFFSSGGVYGSINNGDSVTEEMTGSFDFLQTGNFYGESKRCGEVLCRAFAMEYDIPAKMIRIHHTYGPTLDIQSDTRVFSEFTSNIIKNENIVMKSAGTAKRAFCYLTDAVFGILLILLYGKNGESYNMGNSSAFITISELADILVNLFPEKRLKVRYQARDMDSYVPSSSVRRITVNTRKLEKLGWYPTVSVKEGFYRTITGILEAEKQN